MGIACVLVAVVVAMSAVVWLRGSDAEPKSAATFVQALTRGQHSTVSIDPLSRETFADSTIVAGRVVAIEEGMTFDFGDASINERRCCGGHATLVIDVDRVLAGDATRAFDGRLYSQVPRSRLVPLDQLQEALPSGLPVVGFFSDMSDRPYNPNPTSKSPNLIRPSAVPEQAKMLWAFSWFQSADDDTMVGPYLRAEDLHESYGNARTLDELVAQIDEVFTG